MKLEQSFTVAAPVDEVWAALTDVLRVAPCLPGANITEDAGDGTFKGEFKVKIGPTTASYVGQLKMVELDQEAHVATMDAKGTDKRGNGGTTATIVSRVAPDPESGETRVDVDTDFSITGKLARFGRGGMIQDVSNRLLREFAANLQEDLAGTTAGAATAAPGAAATRVPDAAPATSAGEAQAVGEAAAAVLSGAGADASGQSAPGTSDEPATAAGPAPGAEQAAPPPRAPRPPAEPLDGGGLVLGVLRERLEGTLPAFLLGVIAGLLLARRTP